MENIENIEFIIENEALNTNTQEQSVLVNITFNKFGIFF